MTKERGRLRRLILARISRHRRDGQLRREAALRDRREDRHFKAVAVQAGQVHTEAPRPGTDAAHPGLIREQLRDAAGRDRRLRAAEAAEFQPQPADRASRHAGRLRETGEPQLRREPDQAGPLVVGEPAPFEAGKSIRQSDIRFPANVLRPEAPGRPGPVQEPADGRAGRRLWPPRRRAEPQSEPNRHHLREAGGLPAIEDAAAGGELPAAELDTPQDSQGLQGFGAGTRGEPLRDETVRGLGRLRRLHGTLHGGQEEDVLRDKFYTKKERLTFVRTYGKIVASVRVKIPI